MPWEPEYDPDWDSPEAIAKSHVRGIRDIRERAKEFYRCERQRRNADASAAEVSRRKKCLTTRHFKRARRGNTWRKCQCHRYPPVTSVKALRRQFPPASRSQPAGKATWTSKMAARHAVSQNVRRPLVRLCLKRTCWQWRFASSLRDVREKTFV